MRGLALLSVAASLAVGVVASATAADMPVRNYTKAPVMVPVYNWNGLYIGAHAGYGWGDHDRTVLGGGITNGFNTDGGFGGGQIGYNWQFNNFLLGVEADIAGTGITGRDSPAFNGGTDDSSRLNYIGTVRGRAGITANQWLFYVTGGYAYADVRWSNVAPPTDTFNASVDGWTIGGGIEYGFLPNWSVKGEYRYTDLSSFTRGAPPNGVLPYRVSTTLNQVMVGVNYRFGGF